MRELEWYSGHGTILGTQPNPWQDRDSVLAQFGKREAEAREAYRSYVSEGVVLGRRPELVGGGRSRWGGEWFSVRGQRQRGELGSGDLRLAFFSRAGLYNFLVCSPQSIQQSTHHHRVCCKGRSATDHPAQWVHVTRSIPARRDCHV